jgi:enhancing lycopene biosynthesis protein 2
MSLSQYPRLHRAVLAALADAGWASNVGAHVMPPGWSEPGVALSLRADGRTRNVLLPAAVESRPDAEAVVRAAVAEIRAELVPGG